jgi:aryl sulfotransferase
MTKKLYVGALTDNRRWDHVRIRPDDVFVVTPPKCGTTWMQTIVALLISGDPDVETDLSIKMPWVDIRFREIEEVAARLEAMQSRRCMKSHTPMDGVPYGPDGHYICVFRHPLDAHFSYRKHIKNVPMGIFDQSYPEGDDDTTFKRFLDGACEGFDLDAMPLATITQHYKAALALQDQPNVTLFHYADMKRDLAGVFASVAELLNIHHMPDLMAKLVQTATFDNMKSNAERYAPSGGKGFFRSDTEFFHSGTNGKWHDKLTAEQVEAYGYAIDGLLTKSERIWLENGTAEAHQFS